MGELLCKKDIMKIYDCGSVKALNLLKFMRQMGYGAKINSRYYVSEENHKKFIEEIKGRELRI